MRSPSPGLARHLAAASLGVLACVIFVYASVDAFSALAHGSLRSYLPIGVACSITVVLLCWSTRPLIGQPLFGVRAKTRVAGLDSRPRLKGSGRAF